MAWDPNAPGSTAQSDNQYAASPTTFVASAARTATGTSASITVPGEAVSLELAVSAVSGTSPSMTLSIQWSNDGTNFGSADPVDTFPAMTAVGRRFKHFAVKGRFMRFTWTITGTTPSVTFAVNGVVHS